MNRVIRHILLGISLFATLGIFFVEAGSGKSIDQTKIGTGETLSETGLIISDNTDEDSSTGSITKEKEDQKSNTGTQEKEDRRGKFQERREIIKTLDEGIIKFLQPRDKKSFREIRKNYPDLNDQKSALLIFRNSLVQRYDSFDNKKNKLITDYYAGLFLEIDTQIQQIDDELAEKNEDKDKNIFQSLIDSIFN